jgi:hypothetical protein
LGLILPVTRNSDALPLSVARDAGCRVALLPGLTMRWNLEDHEGKTNAHDAFMIAYIARTSNRPRSLLKPTGTPHVTRLLELLAPRTADRLAKEIPTAMAEQTVVAPDTKTAGLVIPSLARQSSELPEQRRTHLQHSRAAYRHFAVIQDLTKT